jgi:hypothetical protein
LLGEARTGARGEFSIELKLPDRIPIDARLHVVAQLDGKGQARKPGEATSVSREQSPTVDAAKDQPGLARTPALPLGDLTGLTLRLSSAIRDEYSRLMTQTRASLGGLDIGELREDAKQKDISLLAGLLDTIPEAAMALVMAKRVADRLDLPEAAVYALMTDAASGLPSSLLDASDGFKLIDALTTHVAESVSMIDPKHALAVLKTAAEDGRVPKPLAGDAGAKVAERLSELRDRQQLDRPFSVGKTTLAQLLAAGRLPAKRHILFLERWRANLGSTERFWESMAKEDSGFKPAEVARLKRTFEIGALVKNHLPMLEATQAHLGDKQPLSQLAKLEAKDWLAIIRKAGGRAVPPNILPGDGDSPQVLYAREILERVQRRYPTTAIAARLEKKKLLPKLVQEPVTKFFANSPELDLVASNLGSWMENNAERAFAGIKPEVQAATLREVERVQRVLRISRSIDAGEAMINAGLDSAARFHVLGRVQSVELLKERGIAEFEANRLHDVAITRYANSTALLLRYNTALRGLYPAATGPAAPFGEPLEAAIKRHPSLANLFGSQDACAVDPCTSILSPSAYLSDLLLWLRSRRLRVTTPHANALDGLRRRRPDIPNLKLDCPNTNTPLPYIDLVNELLEDAVSPPATPLWRQTRRSATELRAAPEYVNDSAYAVLAGSFFPHALPYDRAFDELSTALAQSSVALWRTREAVLPATPSVAQRAQVAAAAFGIPPAELTLITVPAGTALAQPLSVVWNTANPVIDLEVVGDFLSASQLSYDELLQLLACTWIRAGGAAITISGVDDRCDSNTQRLVGLDAARLDRIHRFLRLWRRTGWAMWELDELLRAPAIGIATPGGAPTLDASAVANLFTVWKLQRATGLDVEELLSFWQAIGTSSHRIANGVIRPSLYARTFENPLLPPAPALRLATVLAAPAPGPALAPVLPAIRAALGLGADEATSLAAAVGGTLNLQSLSAMVRATTLARALRTGFDDLAYLAGGTLNAAFASPATTLALVERADELATAGADLPSVRHMLTRTPTSATRTQEQLTEVLGAARLALQQINDDVRNSDESSLAILQRQLATIPSLRAPSTLATAVSIVDGRFAGSAGDRNAFIATHFGLFMPAAAAQAALTLPLATPATPAAAREAEIAARANALLVPLVRWLTEARIVSAVAGGFSISEPSASLLLRAVNTPGLSTAMLAVLDDPQLISRDPVTGAYNQPLTPVGFPTAFNALRLLDKLAVPVRALKLSTEELDWQIRHGSTIGGLPLAQLPVLTAQPELAIDAWLATSRFVRLDRAFDRLRSAATPPANGIRTLRQLVDAVIGSTLATDADAHAALAAIAGWSAVDVAAAAGAFGATLASGAWRGVSTYVAMHRLLSLATAASASVAQLSAWASVAAPTQAQANEAWQALQSRYTYEAWLQVAPELMDPLRKRRRDALVWRLLSMRNISGEPVWGFDTADLFARFLLDVDMSPCQVTTRIVQAYASIQLFVQRILMNLERELEADPADEDWAQWQWMDRYRVWEAARKVFLYPENWLIEAQRPDRSEVFVAFDRDTQAREATRDGLESAALGYLDRLAEVAQLQVTGMCSEPGTGTLHVIGRSPSDPITYYLRRFVNSRWEPWTKIGVDITAHNAVPAFYAGRLHLFWIQPFIRNEPQQRLPATGGESRTSEPVERYIELRIYASSLRDDVWQPPQMASSSFFDKPSLGGGEVHEEKDAEQFYTLKTQVSGSTLLVELFRVVSPRLIPIRSPLGAFLGAFDAAFPLGRAVFDGRFVELQLQNLVFSLATSASPNRLLDRAKALYGERAAGLVDLPETELEPWLPVQPGLRNAGGALVALQRASSEPTSIPLQLREGSTTNLLLRNVSLPWRVVGLSNDLPFTPESPFVLNDAKRTWFVEPTRYWRNGSMWQTVPPSDPRGVATQLRFTFTRFFHPFVRTFRYVLSSQGFDGFFRPLLQVNPASVSLRPGGAPIDGTPFRFSTGYSPVTPIVRWGSDVDTVDFNSSAPYAGYNWEMFFHLPLFVGNHLSRNQRFDDARKWFHYIFDPTRVSADPTPQRYWITRPLSEQTDVALQQQRINELLVAVNRRDPGALGQVERWRDDPFNPYLLADLRPAAHMKRVVMSYLDNLIAWGDSLFATAAREALNEATLLYVMAAELLGPKPQLIPPPPRASASWNELEPQLDAFANALAAIENYVPAGTGGGAPGGGAGSPPLPAGQTFFFKIPPNDKLLAYWDTVEDRLFKLRHCRGLGGEALSLALFDAPIDPALLVRARAGGLDLGAALSELGAAPPNYRFFEMHRRAVEFTQAVIDMGRDLLAAFESRDAEALAALLADQRRRVQGDAEQVLKWQVDEAKELKKALGYAGELEDYRVQSANGAELMSALEATAVGMKSYLVATKLAGMVKYLIAGGVSAIPKFLIGAAGVGGSPQAGASTGGQQAATIIEYGAKAAEKFLESVEKGADVVKVFAEAEKALKAKQKDGKLAEFEKKRLDREIEAADLRLKIAEYHLEQFGKAADDLDAERDYLSSKFSNEALYDWMVDQLANVYFRAFKLAMSMARRAERCYRFELGMLDSNVVGPSTWDSLRRGLLAGQNLAHDLRRLESSYLDLNVRRKETTRTISLRKEFPAQLFALLSTGTCSLALPELLFDRDYPGHYQRRIVRASISVQRPHADPHDNVVCVATLVGNSVRLSPALGAGYPRLAAPASDARFADQFAPVQGIVTGNAIEDPGLFVRDITDNLADPRYLPFENAGVIGTWKLDLPASRNAIDLSTVSDVKLHLHYSALDGGEPLANAAQAVVIAAAPAATTLVFDAAMEFPEAWEAFLAASSGEQRFGMPLRRGLLPPIARNRTVVLTGCRVHVLSDHGGSFEVELLAPLPTTTTIAAPIAAGALLSTANFSLSSLSMRDISFRLREQGATDWTSLARDRVGSVLVELQLGLS